MLAVITSEEWHKRDLPLKAFLWYLTAAHQTHQSGECVKGLKNPKAQLRSPTNQIQSPLFDSNAELRNVSAIPVGAAGGWCWDLPRVHTNPMGQH